MDFRIRDLSNFVETSICRTMVDAAARLGMTQPSLSESIKRLENDLKRKLFYRSRLGITLTPSGRDLLLKVKPILADLSELPSDRSLPGVSFGHSIIIGCHPALGSFLLPRIFIELEKKIPGFKVDIKHGLSRQVQLETQLGTVDIGFVVDPLPSPDLVVRKFLSDEMCVWRSRHVSHANRVICDSDLFQTKAILKKWKESPKNVVSSSSLELCARLTHGGIGVGILPTRVVELMELDLVRVPNTPSFRDQIFIIHKATFGKTLLERFFLETVKTQTGS